MTTDKPKLKKTYKQQQCIVIREQQSFINNLYPDIKNLSPEKKRKIDQAFLTLECFFHKRDLDMHIKMDCLQQEYEKLIPSMFCFNQYMEIVIESIIQQEVGDDEDAINRMNRCKKKFKIEFCDAEPWICNSACDAEEQYYYYKIMNYLFGYRKKKFRSVVQKEVDK